MRVSRAVCTLSIASRAFSRAISCAEDVTTMDHAEVEDLGQAEQADHQDRHRDDHLDEGEAVARGRVSHRTRARAAACARPTATHRLPSQRYVPDGRRRADDGEGVRGARPGSGSPRKIVALIGIAVDVRERAFAREHHRVCAPPRSTGAALPKSVRRVGDAAERGGTRSALRGDRLDGRDRPGGFGGSWTARCELTTWFGAVKVISMLRRRLIASSRCASGSAATLLRRRDWPLAVLMMLGGHPDGDAGEDAHDRHHDRAAR